MPEQSVYEYILSRLVHGMLPDDFSLSDYGKSDSGDSDDFPLRFADGALDGMAVYHMGKPDFPEGLHNAFKEAIAQAGRENFGHASDVFRELCNNYSALQLIDELQGYIKEHADEINQPLLRKFAIFLLRSATEKELVKIGLSILELYGDPEDDVKKVVRTLALSDEFTVFAAWCARGWTNGNEELFQMAKKTAGWGRIHVIEMLEPETEDIKDWLLVEGINNQVMPQYSALECYKKADVAERLSNDMSHEDFSAVTEIVAALVDEGPTAGISALDDPKAELERYVAQAFKQRLSLRDCECVNAIAGYADRKGWDDLAAGCKALLNTKDVRALVEEQLKRGQGIELAQQLGIPYKDALLDAMRANFDGLFWQCRWLMDDDEHLAALLDLYREKVPLDSIEDDPRDEIGLGKGFETYTKLDMVVQELRHKMPAGLDIVLRTLTSPTVRNRTLTHRVLRCWVSDEGKPLSVVSPEAYERLRYAYEREPREDLRENMLPLLNGETTFDKDLL